MGALAVGKSNQNHQVKGIERVIIDAIRTGVCRLLIDQQLLGGNGEILEVPKRFPTHCRPQGAPYFFLCTIALKQIAVVEELHRQFAAINSL